MGSCLTDDSDPLFIKDPFFLSREREGDSFSLCLREAASRSVPFGSPGKLRRTRRTERQRERERENARGRRAGREMEGKRLVTSACGRIGSRARRSDAAGGSRERNPPEDLIRLLLSLARCTRRTLDMSGARVRSAASRRGRSGGTIKLPLIMTPHTWRFLRVPLSGIRRCLDESVASSGTRAWRVEITSTRSRSLLSRL